MKAIHTIVLAATAAGGAGMASGAGAAATPPAVAASGAVINVAATQASPSVERERIARERAEAHAAYAKQETECQTRFVVTPCIDEARQTERDALARLKRQEVLLDEQARKQRAVERTRAIREGISADEERRRVDAATAASAASSGKRVDRTEHAEPVERSDLAPTPSRTDRSSRELPVAAPRVQDSASRAAREREQIERREAERRAIEEHREAVEARNAARAASGKTPPASLPVPASAAR